MPNVIAVHSVGSFDTWISKNNRSELFPKFCSGYQVFRMPEQNRVAIRFENADLERMQALFESPEGAKAKAEDTVLDPIEVFVEVEGGR